MVPLKQITKGDKIALVDRVQAWSKQQYNEQVTLASAASVPWDLSLSNSFTITLSHNVTLVPANMAAGAYYTLVVRQDAIGGRTLAFTGSFKWVDSLPPTPTLDPNSIDMYTFYYDGIDFLGCQMTKFG